MYEYETLHWPHPQKNSRHRLILLKVPLPTSHVLQILTFGVLILL